MTARAKDTVAEMLACYDRVVDILEDRVALERHMRRNKASFDAILYARESAYVDLVRAVLGHSALYMAETTEAAKSHRRRPAQKAGDRKVRASSPKPEARSSRARKMHGYEI